MAKASEGKLVVTLSVASSGVSVTVEGADGDYDADGFFTMLDQLNGVAEMVSPDKPTETA